MRRSAARPKALLCDADGNLFPSEEPAFAASVVVTERFLAAHGVELRLDPEALRRTTSGKNFRTTAGDLARSHSVDVSAESMQRWVGEEQEAVTRHLAATLEPDPDVLGPLARLGERHLLAAVSSSATARLAACFTATGLDDLIPPERRFSAEDSLPVPTSKPDPAVYRHALSILNLEPHQALVVEDSVPGARSGLAAGIPTIGNIQFVPAEERFDRLHDLHEAGVQTVVGSWGELEAMLMGSPSARARTTRR